MGLVVSQLGNVLQSAVGEHDRGEAGGRQYTAQQLGASMGTALIGAIVISGLIASFEAQVKGNPAIAPAIQQEVGVRLATMLACAAFLTTGGLPSRVAARDAAHRPAVPA
jgi:hypothetical protein